MKRAVLPYFCIVLIVLSIFQFIYIEQQRLKNNKIFINDLNTFTELFKVYPNGTIPKEKQIQNLLSYTSQMEVIVKNTSYRNKEGLSLMVHQLGQFLFMCSNEKIDKYKQFKAINVNLQD